jgi:hypothetical protein
VRGQQPDPSLPLPCHRQDLIQQLPQEGIGQHPNAMWSVNNPSEPGTSTST